MAFLALLNSVIINRGLGPALKGEYAYILNIANIIVLILNLGIYQSYPFYKRQNIEAIKSKYTGIVFFQFFLYIGIAIITSITLSNKIMTYILLLIPIMVISRQLSFITLIESIITRNIINIMDTLFYTGLLSIAYFIFPQKIDLVILALFIREIIAVVFMTFYLRPRINIKNIDFKFMLKIIKFGLFPMFTTFLITINYQMDVIILKWFVPFTEIGYYTVGVGLASQAWLIPDAFKDVLFSKTAKNDSLKDIQYSLKLNFIVNTAIFLIVLFSGKYFITLLYGQQFLPAYTVTVIIFFGSIWMAVFKILIPIYNAKGMQRISFWILLTSAVVNVVLNIILIPRHGIEGAAYASVVSYSICGGLFLYNMKLVGKGDLNV